MNYQNLEQYILTFKEEGKKHFTTSSFQSHSLVLLHMLSRIDPHTPVVFINTGYHFPETINFRDEVMQAFGMDNLIDLKSQLPKSMQVDAGGRLLFTSDPDHCCYINKTQPLDSILRTYDVWINGVRADQSATRSQMKETQGAPHQTMRLHPMLDWSAKQIYDYQKVHNLPKHPLETQGYMSIGCEPCTRKFDLDMQEREARWYGLNKTECGLHTDLIK
ncbi:MAG: phosphoadenylyl-sulfate reductase [Cyclobacteriaceae bacterium]|nr:phosphoadenylyl-sulfate reductase [Cyclobacteriaceae bacterium]